MNVFVFSRETKPFSVIGSVVTSLLVDRIFSPGKRVLSTGSFHPTVQCLPISEVPVPPDMIRISFLISFLFLSVHAGRECVWILGRVQCAKNESKNLNVEVRVLDRDGFGPFQLLDPDDLMGVTFSNEDGSFQLDGCGDDLDWIPGVKNAPEPYIQIRHYCNSDKGETISLPEFTTFVPETYELGVIQLDRDQSKNPRQR